MNQAVKDLKTYKKVTINTVRDLKNSPKYTMHIETNNWFYIKQLLDDIKSS